MSIENKNILTTWNRQILYIVMVLQIFVFAKWPLGIPQGCVLIPVLFTLLTHDCSVTYPTSVVVNFPDDTTVVGLKSDNDEIYYREEI